MIDSAIAPAVTAFLVALVVTRAAELFSRRRRLLDVPNDRSSHVVPTPRIGGLGIIAGVVAAWIVGADWEIRRPRSSWHPRSGSASSALQMTSGGAP